MDKRIKLLSAFIISVVAITVFSLSSCNDANTQPTQKTDATVTDVTVEPTVLFDTDEDSEATVVPTEYENTASEPQSEQPTAANTAATTVTPTSAANKPSPTAAPTVKPTSAPSTQKPTTAPTVKPTSAPSTQKPPTAPTVTPTTAAANVKNKLIPKNLHAEIYVKERTALYPKSVFINVTWDKVDGVRHYEVFLKKNGKWTSRGTTMSLYEWIKAEAGNYEVAVLGMDPDNGAVYADPEEAKISFTVKYFVDVEAHRVDVPIYKTEYYCACNKCGADVTGDENGNASAYGDEYADMDMRKFHHMIQGCSTAFHTESRRVLIGYEPEDVPEEGHYELTMK